MNGSAAGIPPLMMRSSPHGSKGVSGSVGIALAAIGNAQAVKAWKPLADLLSRPAAVSSAVAH